jgi:hypothetical protein
MSFTYDVELQRWDGTEWVAEILPSLDLNFAAHKKLDPRVTFTRASEGTYFDDEGVMQTADDDEARFDHDPATGESLGLLIEEARTNLLLNSATLATQDVTVTAAAHTLSFYGTGTVTLSGVHTATVEGTGAFPARKTLTFTPTAGTLTCTVSGTVEKAQLELGAFATSYIPTTTAQVTRAVDAAVMTGTNFSGWYNAAAGTLYADGRFASAAVTTFPVMVSIDDNSTSNRFQIRKDNAVPGRINPLLVSGGAVQYNVAHSVQKGRNVPFKAALAISTASVNAAVDGSLLGADVTGATMPSPNRLRIGGFPGSTPDCFTAKRLTCWPTRLPNEALERLTK